MLEPGLSHAVPCSGSLNRQPGAGLVLPLGHCPLALRGASGRTRGAHSGHSWHTSFTLLPVLGCNLIICRFCREARTTSPHGALGTPSGAWEGGVLSHASFVGPPPPPPPAPGRPCRTNALLFCSGPAKLNFSAWGQGTSEQPAWGATEQNPHPRLGEMHPPWDRPAQVYNLIAAAAWGGGRDSSVWQPAATARHAFCGSRRLLHGFHEGTKGSFESPTGLAKGLQPSARAPTA